MCHCFRFFIWLLFVYYIHWYRREHNTLVTIEMASLQPNNSKSERARERKLGACERVLRFDEGTFGFGNFWSATYSLANI